MLIGEVGGGGGDGGDGGKLPVPYVSGPYSTCLNGQSVWSVPYPHSDIDVPSFNSCIVDPLPPS
jgi:hypothetical protein